MSSLTTDAFALADVYNVHGSLPRRCRGQASWVANTLIYNQIRQFDTAGGAGLWARLGEGQPEGLLARRAVEAEDMDAAIGAGAENYVLVFRDLSAYVIADRVPGMTIELVPRLFGANRRPTGQRGWHAWARWGADVVNDTAIAVLNVIPDIT